MMRHALAVGPCNWIEHGLGFRRPLAPDHDPEVNELAIFSEISSHDLVPVVLEALPRCESFAHLNVGILQIVLLRPNLCLPQPTLAAADTSWRGLCHVHG
jgi:hypothetical protein